MFAHRWFLDWSRGDSGGHEETRRTAATGERLCPVTGRFLNG